VPSALSAVQVDLFPWGACHVHDCGLGSAPDAAVWEFAAQGGFIIVSKDLDFHDRSVLRAGPPKVIWLRTGNCSTARVEELFDHFFLRSNCSAGMIPAPF